jgi:tRNA(fMet)-specific endonuclease VapC
VLPVPSSGKRPKKLATAVTSVARDSAAAREYGRLRTELERQGQLPGGLDLMIAAQAMALGVILVTGDRAFGRIKNLKTEDWTK